MIMHFTIEVPTLAISQGPWSRFLYPLASQNNVNASSPGRGNRITSMPDSHHFLNSDAVLASQINLSVATQYLKTVGTSIPELSMRTSKTSQANIF